MEGRLSYFPTKELIIPETNEEDEPMWQMICAREFHKLPLTPNQDRGLVELCHKNGTRNVGAWIEHVVKKMIVYNRSPYPGEENESYWFESGEEEDSQDEGGSEEEGHEDSCKSEISVVTGEHVG